MELIFLFTLPFSITMSISFVFVSTLLFSTEQTDSPRSSAGSVQKKMPYLKRISPVGVILLDILLYQLFWICSGFLARKIGFYCLEDGVWILLRGLERVIISSMKVFMPVAEIIAYDTCALLLAQHSGLPGDAYCKTLPSEMYERCICILWPS